MLGVLELSLINFNSNFIRVQAWTPLPFLQFYSVVSLFLSVDHT